MKSWTEMKLPNCLVKHKIKRKNQILASEINQRGLYPVIDQGQSFIAGYTDDESKLINNELPLIIFGDHTRCFKYVDFPFVLGADGTKPLKCNTDIFIPKFFYFALLGLNIENRGYNRHFKLLKESFIPRPKKEEQRRIAAVLTHIQKAIEQQEQMIELTTELKKSLMHKLFTEGTRGEPQKQTEIGPVPESWIVSKLKEFCILQRGFDITKKEQKHGEIPVVSSGGIRSYHNEAKIKGPGVVIGRKGSLGTVHYIVGDFWPHDTTLWVKDFKTHNPKFTAYFLDALDLKRFDSGAANPTLNRNTIHAEMVAFPRKKEQAEIGQILSTVDEKLNKHRIHFNKMSELFRTLLHQLMTAQIRVNDIDLSELGIENNQTIDNGVLNGKQAGSLS